MNLPEIDSAFLWELPAVGCFAGIGYVLGGQDWAAAVILLYGALFFIINGLAGEDI